MKRHSIRSLSLAGLSALALSSGAVTGGPHAGNHGHGNDAATVGKPGIATGVNRTINIDMTDNMRFTPSAIQVRQGETIRFIVRNAGRIKHEFTLGTAKELTEHARLMQTFPDMTHDEPNKIALAPGAQGEIVWQFTTPGNVNFACLYPGHHEAGMKGQIKVAQP
jgi:uncharacterized cupredoxin-like copper-binding protein